MLTVSLDLEVDKAGGAHYHEHHADEYGQFGVGGNPVAQAVECVVCVVVKVVVQAPPPASVLGGASSCVWEVRLGIFAIKKGRGKKR